MRHVEDEGHGGLDKAMDIRDSSHPARRRRDVRWAALALAAMVALAAVVLANEFRPRPNVAVDTRVESGTHVTFVVVAPTSIGSLDPKAVKTAKLNVREWAQRSGYFFSTVGVSDDWSTERALANLAEFGAFDELIVGRNWFNTGIEKYVSQFEAVPAVPQLIILLQELMVDTIPFQYLETRELLRLVGSDRIEAWARAGSRLQGSTATNPDAADPIVQRPTDLDSPTDRSKADATESQITGGRP